MSDPHVHHHSPQFYQRGFTSDRGNKIWVYQKEYKPRRRSIRSTGMQIELYTFQDTEGRIDSSSVEKYLALLDDRAAKIIQRLETGGQLTPRDRERLCEFVSVIWRRTPLSTRTLRTLQPLTRGEVEIIQFYVQRLEN